MVYFPGRRHERQSGRGQGADLTRRLLVLILTGAVSLFLSCNPLANVGWGSLTIQVTPMKALLMTPAIDMTISSYLIAGSGPNGAAFSKTITGSSLSLPGLAFGTWNIAVDGQNAAGTLISHGEASVTIMTGTNQTVSVAMAPITGPGTFTLTVTWLAASVDLPSIQSQLIPGQGSPIDLTFSTPSPGKATYSSSTIPNGYYILVAKLLDNGQLVMGAVDVVRIVNGQTTSGAIDFSQVNTGIGSIIVNITPNLNSPVLVTMSGQQAELGAGAATTVTASVAQGLGTVTYVWYLNGVSQATGPAFTFNSAGAPLNPGGYRIDVAAFTSNGSRGGSTTFVFKVFSTGQVTLMWDLTTNPSVTGMKFYTGTASSIYGTPVDVGFVTTYTVKGLLSGHTYNFAVTAYNSSKQESGFSNEVKYAVP